MTTIRTNELEMTEMLQMSERLFYKYRNTLASRGFETEAEQMVWTRDTKPDWIDLAKAFEEEYAVVLIEDYINGQRQNFSARAFVSTAGSLHAEHQARQEDRKHLDSVRTQTAARADGETPIERVMRSISEWDAHYIETGQLHMVSEAGGAVEAEPPTQEQKNEFLATLRLSPKRAVDEDPW